MISISKACCGCGACQQICPKNCITMESDKEGFIYPSIDTSKCVDCGICERVCPINKTSNCDSELLQKPVAYGGFHSNESILKSSSSGGFFSLIAEDILAENGAVYGCALNSDNVATHIRIDKTEDLEKLRGSKYVQSDTCAIFDKIVTDLMEGRRVLFTGTPCQCASVKSYIIVKNKDLLENLFLCDFICHGVPSPAVFKAYIDTIETENNSKVKVFRFRNKDHGWNPSGLQLGTYIETESGAVERNYPAINDYYMNGFLDDLFLRPSCYECSFKELPKDYSDITFADFWGVNKAKKTIYNNKGTSLVLVNSEKGQKLFDKCKDDFIYEECDVKKALKRNKTIIKSAHENVKRKQFFDEFIAGASFKKLEKKYMTKFHWFFHKISGMAWNILKSVIKSIFGFFLKVVGIKWEEKQWNSFFQFVKFCIVGVSNSAVSYCINITILTLLRPLVLDFDYVIANVSAFILSVLWSFYWNNGYVFKEGSDQKRSKIKTLFKTYLVYAFSGIVLNNVLGTIWIKGLHLSKYLAPLLNIPFTLPCNFLLNKFFTFSDRTNKKK